VAPASYRASIAISVVLGAASVALVWRYARGGRFEA